MVQGVGHVAQHPEINRVRRRSRRMPTMPHIVAALSRQPSAVVRQRSEVASPGSFDG